MIAPASRGSRVWVSCLFILFLYLNEAGSLQFGPFGIGEQPGSSVKGLAGVAFERKRAAVAVDHIDDQLRVLPVFILRREEAQLRSGCS
jgi:hypothetical protein